MDVISHGIESIDTEKELFNPIYPATGIVYQAKSSCIYIFKAEKKNNNDACKKESRMEE